MGNRYIRRLLYLGAMAQIAARRKRGPGEDWLWGLRPFVRSHHPLDDVPPLADHSKLQNKPVKLVAIALASRMARTIWALLKTGERYKVPTA